jgi:hypothetical protein
MPSLKQPRYNHASADAASEERTANANAAVSLEEHAITAVDGRLLRGGWPQERRA